MNLRKLALAGTAAAALIGVPAQASIIDNPQFRVLGVVIVWGADATGGIPIVSDFIINDDNGVNDTDLIGGADVHTVVTGTLDRVADVVLTDDFTVTDIANPPTAPAAGSDGVIDVATFGAFELGPNTDVLGPTVNSSFFVASNTAFSIEAEAAAVTENGFDLADIGMDMSVTLTGDDGLAFGDDAQFPHDGGATAGFSTPANLGVIEGTANAQTIFTGNQATAATPGSIADQSVRFDIVYSLGGGAGYDLSDGAGEVEATVTYTVFVP